MKGEWIEWTDSAKPPEGTVEVKLRGGDHTTAAPAKEFDWRHIHADEGQDIIAYRIVEPETHG